MLCFHGEQEAAGEGVNIVETWNERDVFVWRGRGEVSVREDDEPPDEGEQQPGEDEGEGEHEQRPAPLRVHEGREDVLKVSAPALGYVPLDDVAVTVLKDDALSDASRCVTGLTVSGNKEKNFVTICFMFSLKLHKLFHYYFY